MFHVGAIADVSLHPGPSGTVAPMPRFGEFELDEYRHELRRNGVPVHLEPQAFDLLVYLVDHRDRLVPKTELLDGVWGHRHVAEAALTTRIKEVRRAVGDDGTNQHTIQTVRGRGYRFVAPELADPATAPRPRAVELVGRERDLDAITAALTPGAVVTLIGPGGVGKSALARAVLAGAAGSFSAGAHFVELATVDSDEAVVPAVARALDVVLDARRPTDTILAIARLDALLVLDNCEHVVAGVTALLDEIAATSGARITVFSTSRQALDLSQEMVIPLPALGLTDARELFRLRCQAVAPGWDPLAIPTDAVDRLVSGLDRLPLTIEMAAGRAGSMTFTELADAIEQGTPLLQVSHRARAGRHRSLASLLRWSTELLEPDRRELFEGFAVFAGSVTAEDVAAVLGSGEGPPDPSGVRFDLAALVERSLLVADTTAAPSRYSMLVTIRTAAVGHLEDSGRAGAARGRHAEHYLEVLREIDDVIRTPQEADGRHALGAVVAEIRAAHTWATTVRPALAAAMSDALFHAAYSSLWSEPVGWSRALLARGPYPVAVDVAGAQVLAAGGAAHRGDLAEARRLVGSVLVDARGRTRANALEVLADIALYEGELEEAVATATELARLGEELDDDHARAFAAVDQALALAYGGHPGRALDALSTFPTDDIAATDRAWLALARGDALSFLHEADALGAYSAAIELGGLVDNSFVVSCARTSLGKEYARTGDFERALEAYRESLADFQRHGNATHAVTALRNLVGLLADLGDDRGALLIAGAVADEGLRVSYGTEAERIADVLESIEGRVGSSRFTEWLAAGRALDVDQAVRRSAELVAGHLA